MAKQNREPICSLPAPLAGAAGLGFEQPADANPPCYMPQPEDSFKAQKKDENADQMGPIGKFC